MKRVFPIAGAGPGALIFMGVLAVAMGVAAVLLLTPGAGEGTGRYIGAGVAAVVAALFAWLALAQSRSALVVGDGMIKLRVPLYGRRIPLVDIDTSGIERVDLDARGDFRLTWRTNGVGLPGYSLGWYRSAGRGKILAAVTGPVNIAIPVDGQYTVLATVESLQGVLDALDAGGR